MVELVNPNLSTRIAMFGPKIDDVVKLYTEACSNTPGVDGPCLSISMKDALAHDFTDFDRLAKLMPAGQVMRISVTVTPADPDAGYDFVTVPLRILDNPPEDKQIAVIWGPHLEDDFVAANQIVYDHLADLGLSDQLEGFGIGGLCSRIGDAEFTLCSSNDHPYEDLSQPWLDAGYTPELVAGVLTRVAVRLSAIKPGQLMVFCVLDGSRLSLGGKEDHGAWFTSLITAMRDAAGTSRVVPMWQSATPGTPLPPVLTALTELCGGIALQETEGTLFNDPVPGALFIERHITDWAPGFQEQAQAQAVQS